VVKFTPTPVRWTPVRARFGIVVLLALALTAVAMVAPPGVAAETPHGDRHGRAGGPGGDPGPSGPGGAPGDTAGDPSFDASGDATNTNGGGNATVTSELNLRAGPSTDSDVLAVMPAGSTVEVTGDPENGFYPVSFDGAGGYAYGDYLDFGGGAASAPATSDAGAGETDIVAIIYAAADAYGQSREDMLRVATCESGLDPNQVTPPYDASGLFQFLPSTWASTPYADQDIFDPVANANAAAWMWSVGRRNEWVCQ
jgi:uncharacterized protein YraI